MQPCGPAVNEERSALLRLPFEIRRVILEELLEDPLSTDRLPVFPAVKITKLHPAILGTCKQLHDEGVAILYSHTLHFEIWHDTSINTHGRDTSSYRCQPVYTGRSFPSFASHVRSLNPERQPDRLLPPAIARRISQVNVQVNARRVHGHYDTRFMSEQLRILANVVHNHPHWQTISLRAYTSAGTSLHEGIMAGDMSSYGILRMPLFSSFRKVRGRRLVTCDGLDPVLAADMTTRMMTTEPDYGIDADKLCDEIYALDDAVHPLSRALLSRNETGFAEVRYSQELQSLGLLARDVEDWRDHCVTSEFLSIRRAYLEKMKDLLDDFHPEGGASVVATKGDIAWVRTELRRLLEQDFEVP